MSKVVTIVSGVLAFASVFFTIGKPRIAVMIVTIILFVAFYLAGNKYRETSRKYSSYIKNNVVLNKFKNEFENVTFDQDKGFERNYIRNTKMYPMGDIFTSNDLLKGSYKDVKFTQANVIIRDENVDAEKRKTIDTIFKGRWLIYDFNKEFSGTLQLRSNFGRTYTKNKKVRTFFEKNKWKKIEYEDRDFNKMFNAYTDNPHEAYYIMTTHMMESMKVLSERLECEIIVSFIDNKLHIAIFNDEDAFEIGSNIFSSSFINTIDRQIELIKYVVDGLDLDKESYKI